MNAAPGEKEPDTADRPLMHQNQPCALRTHVSASVGETVLYFTGVAPGQYAIRSTMTSMVMDDWIPTSLGAQPNRTEELYDSSNAAKIADGGFKHGQQFNCHVARGELTLIQANLLAHFPAEELSALLAKAARQMNLVAGTSERRERRHISVDGWRHDVG
jgi:hypothetical protein